MNRNAVEAEFQRTTNLPVTRVDLINTHNHLYQISSAIDGFLKLYTKDWYPRTGTKLATVVDRENTAYGWLNQQQLGEPLVLKADYSEDNEIGQPYLLLHRASGQNLTDWLKKCSYQETLGLLTEAGTYLRAVHKRPAPQRLGFIQGRYLPNQNIVWHHRGWSLEGRLETTDGLMEKELAGNTLAQETVKRFLDEQRGQMAEEYQQVSFIHGDCHPRHFFAEKSSHGWRISGLVDMENASVGDSVDDLVGFFRGLKGEGYSPAFWEAFLSGYGVKLNIETFKARLLSLQKQKLYPNIDVVAAYQKILEAKSWGGLF
ncbi:aminoglycoside phosphotransferase family protein [Patescibacteria group bacterium]|nr:aminoglycoside phosphotransferase family protein [Patescibacteria group bacterium]